MAVDGLDRLAANVSPQQRIDDLIRIAEQCIDVLKESEEHHGEVFFIYTILVSGTHFHAHCFLLQQFVS